MGSIFCGLWLNQLVSFPCTSSLAQQSSEFKPGARSMFRLRGSRPFDAVNTRQRRKRQDTRTRRQWRGAPQPLGIIHGYISHIFTHFLNFAIHSPRAASKLRSLDGVKTHMHTMHNLEHHSTCVWSFMFFSQNNMFLIFDFLHRCFLSNSASHGSENLALQFLENKSFCWSPQCDF